MISRADSSLASHGKSTGKCDVFGFKSDYLNDLSKQSSNELTVNTENGIIVLVGKEGLAQIS